MKTKNHKLTILLMQGVLLSFLLTPITLIEALAVTVPKPPTTSGLVGEWTFDSCTGGTVVDWAGWGNNATLVGSPTCGTGGQVGPGALTLNGTSQYASVPDNTVFSPGTGDFTISAWVKPSGSSIPSRTQYIWNDYGDWPTVVNLQIEGSNGIGTPAASFSDSNSADTVTATSSIVFTNNANPPAGALPLNQWALITATRSGGTVTIYVNGVQTGQKSGTLGNIVTSNDNPPAIGYSLVDTGSVASGNQTNFQGSIDDVRIYNRALTLTGGTSSDISVLYNFTGPSAVTTALRNVPPVVLSATPTGFLPANTTNAIVTAITDEAAICGYSTVTGTAYASMTTFSSDLSVSTNTTHTFTISVSPGNIYSYYIRCKDSFGNIATNDYGVFFSLLAAPNSSTSSGNIIPADRVSDWTTAGITWGIPNLPLATQTTMPDGTVIPAGKIINVKNSPYNAKGDGVTNDTSAIQAAINASNTAGGDVVYLPTGSYLLDPNISLQIGHPLVLRGDGAGKTILLPNAADPIAFSYFGLREPDTTFQVNLTSGYTKGSTSLVVADTSNMHVGQEIELDELNDPAVVSVVGNDGTCGAPNNSCGRNGLSFDSNGVASARAMQQIVEIKSINAATKTITIDTPLYYTYQPSLSPQAFFWSGSSTVGNMKYEGVENLSINGNGHTALFYFSWCSYAWVKDVEAYNLGRAAILFLYGYKTEVRDNYFHDALNNAPGSYGMEYDSVSNSLIQNNIFWNLASTFVSTGPISGNVISYNWGTTPHAGWLDGTIEPHAAHADMNLYEANVVPSVIFDDIWGSGSQETMFRNYFSGTTANSTNNRFPITLNSWQRYANVVGNVLGTPGFHTQYEVARVSPATNDQEIYSIGYFQNYYDGLASYDDATYDTLLRTGNYDTVHAAVVWDSSTSNQTLTPSLYLTSKPAWFTAPAGPTFPSGTTLPWPPVGPDIKTGNYLTTSDANVNKMVNLIPAQQCFQSQKLVTQDANGNYINSGTFNPTACYSTTATSTAKYGDVNGDGSVNIADALMEAQYVVGLNPTGFNLQAADILGNGNVNINDALLIAQYSIGLQCTTTGCKLGT